ncbi:MAG: DNA replication and repair protein RecF [Treponema sp.]|nr:DNA replication and repair protein RecF [Spirochaetia bacterium]MDD6296176.1 DNA replication and repair protein RecF [Treponema sp.]MDD7450040.1 DNA replication and repair protein RecF [Treponema sp.]MDY2923863.1 DNA replication and repair protein RecF [Treponema sp.]MDY5684624.1 DNA replication and repair protein RecF [Treponema sp.]
MPFLNLSLYNFRNLKNDTIDLLAKEVYFVGENGQGKSNLLEALYFSAYGNSFRTNSDSEIVRKEESIFKIRAFFKTESITQSISILYENSRKKVEKNGKRISDRKELINTIPCVLFCHDDLSFAVGEPEKRRFFIDQSLSMYDVLYLDFLRRYKKVLKSRNAILKEHNYNLLDVYNKQLIENGLMIQKKRKDMIFQFNEIFGKLYEQISGIEGLTINYEPSWKEIEDNVGSHFPSSQEIFELLKSKEEHDKIMETTLSGPHRDRIRFMKDKKPFIPTASTGQRRLISLLLRTAQAVFYTKMTGKKPVLLMDDVMLELDPEKRKKLTNLLPEYDQMFCTFLPGEPYENYKHSTTKVYFLNKGEWSENA